MARRPGFYLFCAPEGLLHFTATNADLQGFLDKCAEGGIRRIVSAMVSTEPPSPLRPKLVQYAHERGIEVIIYKAIGWAGNWEWIYHSNAGEPLPNPVLAPFAQRHPEYWSRTREGKIWLNYGYRHMLGKLGILDFTQPEVRAYERELLLDMVACGADGVQVEWVASPRPPDDPEKDRSHTIDWALDERGTWGYGYDDVAVTKFRQTYGDDPRTLPSDDARWLAWRCGYLTKHISELRAALQGTGRNIEFSAQGVSGLFRDREAGIRTGFDWLSWVEEGLIDAIYPRWPAQYPRLQLAYTPEVVARMGPEIDACRKLLRGRARLMAGLLLPTYSFLTKELVTPEDAYTALAAAVESAVANGADMVGIYRADRLDALGLWPYLKRLTQLAT